MVHPADPGGSGVTSTLNPNGGVGNRLYGPFATDSTTLSGIPGQGATQWEHPHDPKALHLPMLRGKKLLRGYIVQDKNDPAVAQNRHGKPLGLRFLYNPTTVQVSYQLSTDIYPSGASPGSAVPLIGVPGSASLSFDLILDRTYDVWKNPASKGIRYDVEQFQSMVGYTAATPFIQPVGLYVVFGNRMLKYFGFVQSFSIVYTNWTQQMVPYRGALSGLTMQVLPSGKSTKSRGQIAISNPNNYTAAGITSVDGSGRRHKKNQAQTGSLF